MVRAFPPHPSTAASPAIRAAHRRFNGMTKSTPASKFPAHSEPRVWLLTAGKSPIGIALSRQLLAHGDSVVFGTKLNDAIGQVDDQISSFSTFWHEEVEAQEGWKSRARVIGLDGRCEVATNRPQCRNRFTDSLHYAETLANVKLLLQKSLLVSTS
ncbi:MAG: hypothetical protein Q9222_006220 [Ikaeria aurantiellina]